MWKIKVTNYLHCMYRSDPWVQALYHAAGAKLDEIEADIAEWHENRYFDGYTFALPIWEYILGMRPGRKQGDASRKSALRAKWLSNRKSDRALLQDIADSWQPDALKVGFDGGYITLTADGTIFRDWRYVLAAINDAKPAHLPLMPVIRSHSTLYIGGTLIPSYTQSTLPQWAPVHKMSTTYIGGTLIPSYTQSTLPQWTPTRTLSTTANSGGMICSTSTTVLPSLEVT